MIGECGMTDTKSQSMNDSSTPDDVAERLEVVALLDERYRLRDNPSRRRDLDVIYARLHRILDQRSRR
jgi:hypothetical protein